MNAGGIETWLMHVFRNIDRGHYQFDFLTDTLSPCFYDDEIRSLGGRIFPCLDHKIFFRYGFDVLQLLKNNGPYDVVHSHVHHFSGFVLLLARLAGVPTRIAHSHNNTTYGDSRASLLRSFYLRITEYLIAHCATVGLTCSRDAASCLYGNDWESNSSRKVLPYGIDLNPFLQPVSRTEILSELSIPVDSIVVGHVGRFAEQKNHMFLLDVFHELTLINVHVRLLLIGDGQLLKAVEEKVKKLKLTDKVIFAGVRADIPRLMSGVMNVFVLPSFNEGLPLVLIEAQAAGLPCIISDAVTPEICAVPHLIESVALNASPREWANVVANRLEKRKQLTEPLAILRHSSFDAMTSIRELKNIYNQAHI
jgi:glycosyltransferase involved in cell wall biosynthesis